MAASIAGRVLDAYGDPLENSAGPPSCVLPAAGANAMMPAASRHRPTISANTVSRGSSRADTSYTWVRPMQNEFPSMMDARGPSSPQPSPTSAAHSRFLSGSPEPGHAQPVVVAQRPDRDWNRRHAFRRRFRQSFPASWFEMMVSPSALAVVQVRSVSGESGGGFDSRVRLRPRPDGTFRLTLPPGEYGSNNPRYAAPRAGATVDEQFTGIDARQTFPAADVDGGSPIVVGRGASATGRVVFEGDRRPSPAVPSQTRVPFDSRGRDGVPPRRQPPPSPPDWTFKIDMA